MIFKQISILIALLIVSNPIYSAESPLVTYANKLKSDIEDDISKIKQALGYSFDGLLLNLIPSDLIKQAKREPIEVASVYRFKCIKKISDVDFANWISKQNNDSIKKILDPVDSHPNKASLITWQNETYAEYLSTEQAFERLLQTKHLEIKTKDKNS